ncbi:C-type mannose receptor 2-like [Pollicipes pollicipes]|uniref:C-type mannose receptor 2-like n=1 Tax=Pollicipes pollicipes TaxID=41117 RepID=UPI0018858612|nr:C-type mannose receptor 2-like [Pollicipes pollicipes]
MRPARLCALLLALVAAARAICPGHPWQEWQGSCYRLTYDAVPWHGVRGDCKVFFRSADAASVTSKDENDFIKNLAGQKAVWLGLRSTNNLLTWTDGTAVSYRNFPGSRTQTKGAEDVVQMEPSGRWRFAASHTAGALRGVCKMPSCRCPSGWREWDRRCYRAVTSRVSWTEARQRCRKMAPTADLVSIINERENNFVFDLLKEYPFWIGLNDREREGQFVWSSGEKYPYTNWHRPSEPNGVKHSQDCAEMLQDKTWADNSCHVHNGRTRPFVCELIICGRAEQILREPVRDAQIRLWQPNDELRCPDGWSRSGSRCYSSPTAPNTFARVQAQCASRHPQGTVALLRSVEENDRAFFAAGSLPMWIDYGSRSGRAVPAATERLSQPTSTFTYWEPNVKLARSVDSDCAGMEQSSQWRPHRCDVDRLPGLCEIPACDPTCPPGWIPFGGHCYRLVGPKRTRADAAAVCQRDGGQLASIQSQDENDFITTLAFRSGTDFSDWTSRYAWIGAGRADPTAAWAWADCDAWTMARWHGGDGDDSSRTTGTCAALLYTGRWRDDVNCERGAFSSVCELDPCRKQFGPADRSGCRTGKVTEVTEPPPKVTKLPPKATEPPPTSAPVKKERFICPPDWTQLDDYCYKGVIEPDTFIGALQTCTVTFSPAHVASVHSPRENRLLLELTGGGPSWLGLTSAYDFPRWRWLDMRVVAEPTCPDPTNWREEAGSCYAFHRDGQNYLKARVACARMAGSDFGVRLPVVENALEDAALQTPLQQAGTNHQAPKPHTAPNDQRVSPSPQGWLTVT